MQIQDFLKHLDGVRQGAAREWYAKCPAHDDRNPSLAIGEGDDGRILLTCHAGCSTSDILHCMGLTEKDLFPDHSKPAKKSDQPIYYNYSNGTRKVRYDGKNFRWEHLNDQDQWVFGRGNGTPHCLYISGNIEATSIFCVEGEKDADTINRLTRCTAVSSEHGASKTGESKWWPEYTEQLRGKKVYVLQDHDKPGHQHATATCTALKGIAKEVYLLDLSKVWPEIPEHGDISDMFTALGAEEGCHRLGSLAKNARPFGNESGFLSLFHSLDSFPEENATWIIPGWIPAEQITLITAEGGTGKTSFWINLLAGLSAGSPTILDLAEGDEAVQDFSRDPMEVCFISTEDSVPKKLRKKLRQAGAKLSNIFTADLSADKDGLMRDFKFGSDKMSSLIREQRPAVCVLDPIQGFIPRDVNMGSRNAMRDCLSPLISLGEETGTSFLLICHTNKRPGASGRDRVADSADLWDIARSVIMAGFTDNHQTRYLSQEKSNYGPLQETVLYGVDDLGRIIFIGRTWKRDRDFVNEAQRKGNSESPTKQGDAVQEILSLLDQNNGSVASKELMCDLQEHGFSEATINRAKRQMKKDGQIEYTWKGKGASRTVYTALKKNENQEGQTPAAQFYELPSDTETPFDQPERSSPNSN